MLCQANEDFCEISNLTWAIITAVLFILSIPFTFLQNFKRFVPINLFAICLSFTLIITILFLLLRQMVFGEDITDFKNPEKHYRVFSLSHFLKFFGITLFSLELPCLIFPIKNKLKDQNDFNKILFSVSMVEAVFTVLLCVGAYFVSFNLNFAYFFGF